MRRFLGIVLLPSVLLAAVGSEAQTQAPRSAVRVVKDDFEGYASQGALVRRWSGTGLVLSEKHNRTQGGKRSLALPSTKGALTMRRDLSETPTLGSVSIWVLDHADTAEAWSVECGNGSSGDSITVYTVPWSPSNGRRLNSLKQVDRVATIADPCSEDRTAGWQKLTFRWTKKGCAVLVNDSAAWNADDLTDGLTYIRVGRFWGEDQPYEARREVAWDDLEATLEGEPQHMDLGPVTRLIQRPSYSYAALRSGVWRDRPVSGRSFWAMNYFGGDTPNGRPAKEVLTAARKYGLGDAWYTWGNFDAADMAHLRLYATDPGPLLVTTDPEAMQRLTYRLTPEREANIAELDGVRKGRVVGALHGEWDNALDFYFGGYPKGDLTRKQAYQTWEKHYKTVIENCKGRIVSVNGYGYYQHYAARWGTDRMVGVEVCENIPATQPHFAFTRGAARQYDLSWYTQMSPWFAGTILSYDKFSPWTPGPGSGTWGPTHGHSVNMLERHWYAAWLGGANVVCAEANGWNAFDLYNPDGTPRLSPLGLAWRKFVAFAKANPNRGVAVTPFGVVLDQYNGFNGGEQPWRHFRRTQGDEMASDLFSQFYPGTFDRGLMARDQGYLTHTPYGDTVDALLSDASARALAAYPVLFCVGDFEPDRAFAERLRQAASQGSIVVVHRTHAAGPLIGLLPDDAGVRATRHEGLSMVRVGRGMVLVIEREALRIPRDVTRALADAVLPLKIDGRAQITLSRTPRGWLVGLINNDGVHKPSPTSAPVIDPSAATKVRLLLPAALSGVVTDLQSGRKLTPRAAGSSSRALEVTLRPGEVRALTIDAAVAGRK